MLFKQDIQTGMIVFVLVFVLTVSIQEQVKRSADGWSYLLKNKIAIYWRTRSATPSIKWVISKNKIKNSTCQDQGDMKFAESRMRINVWLFALKRTRESAYIFFYLFIGSCVQFCQVCRIKSHPQRKGFSWKSFIHCLKIRDWDQCTSCSYTRTRKFLLSWIFLRLVNF